MRLGYIVTEKDELIGSYEPDKVLKGTAEDYNRPTVVELMQNWNKYRSYARGKHKLCDGNADDLLSCTLSDLASEEEVNEDTYKSLECHVKARIDYVYASGISNTKVTFRPNNKDVPLEFNYEGSERDSVCDLSDKLQVSKGDGLYKSLIDIRSEIEESKPYRYSYQGVDMFKVLYILMCSDEYADMNVELSDTLYILQNILGYDNEALENIKFQLSYSDSKMYELWKSLNLIDNSLDVMGEYISCSGLFKSIFLKK